MSFKYKARLVCIPSPEMEQFRGFTEKGSVMEAPTSGARFSFYTHEGRRVVFTPDQVIYDGDGCFIMETPLATWELWLLATPEKHDVHTRSDESSGRPD